MSARQRTSADAATTDVPGRYGDGAREGYGDAASGRHRSIWDFDKMEHDDQASNTGKGSHGLLHQSRIQLDRGLIRARKWQTRVGESGGHYYQKWIVEGLLRQKPLPPSQDGRHIPLDAGAVRREPLLDERSGKHYKSNTIRSNRYSLVSFLPKQLIFQFGRLANFYFLVIGILQQVPGWSPTGKFTTIAPLAAFVALTMAKEGWDDYRRYLLDREDNQALIAVLAPSGIPGEPSTTKGRNLFGRKTDKKKRTEEESDIATGGYKSETDREAGWMRIKWQDVRVGDIIRLERNDRVPADIVLLHATGPNNVAYIDTMALDGETNLKSKQPSTLLANRCDTIAKLEKCAGELVCEDPNANLYYFEGRITVEGETAPLTINEVVFRGSTIRNTSETIGVVVNTGEECKIRMNGNQYVHTKSPRINRFTNRIVVALVVILLAITAGISGGYVLWQREYERNNPYLSLAPVGAAPLIVGTIILINGLIPLSLYIVIEFVKVFQAYFMNDIEMYDAATDTPISINTNTILEDLGQVSYIFSDKTGTLTENNMQFRKLTVGGTSWLHTMNMSQADLERALHQNQDESVPKTPDTMGKSSDGFDSSAKTHLDTATETPSAPRSGSATDSMLNYMQQSPHTPFSKQARQFLLCIALCHTCLPETSKDGKITFQAASPDEVALIQAAQDLGYLLIDRPAQSIKLQLPDPSGQVVQESYEVLKVVEFSSSRKRMSIVVRMPDGRICVICKGADNVIMNRLRLSDLATETAGEVDRKARQRHSMEAESYMRRKSMASPASPRASYGQRSGYFRRHSVRESKDLRRLSRASRQVDDEARSLRSEPTDLSDEPDESGDGDGVIDESIAADETKVFQKCFQHIDQYATEGLRVLLYGYRYLSDREYEDWTAAFNDATTSLVDRQKRIEEAAESIEKDFELAGGSAIEDKLQVGVPETIDKLRRANIKIWMLTGDKRETAINIARSANLARSFSEIYMLDATADDPQATMISIFADIERGLVSHTVLVIDGHTLSLVEDSEHLSAMFFDLAVRIDSVICCRAAPSQKANLVKGIRDTNSSRITLAIGDGANDIAMIQAAHVGIGISGREGLQAARVADYAIAQFRFLQRLLLVHGHWLYLRTSKYILCTFWKEWVFYIIQAQYQRFNGYSGTSLYQSWSLTAYNAAFTSLPIFFLGLCEQDLSPETLLAVPELYTFGQRDEGINLKKCIAWLFTGTVDTITVFVILWAEFTYNFTGFSDRSGFLDPGHDNALYPMGSLALTIVIILINVKILIFELHNKTWIPLTAFTLSISLWFFFLLIIDDLPIKYSEGENYRTFHAFTKGFGNSLSWWAVAIVGILIVLGANLASTALQRVFFPTDRNLWQELEKRGEVDKYLTEYNVEEAPAEARPSVSGSQRNDQPREGT